MNDIDPYAFLFLFVLFVFFVCVCFVFFFAFGFGAWKGEREEQAECKVVSGSALLLCVMHSRLNPIFVEFNENVEPINLYHNFKVLEVLNLDSYP